MLIIDKLRCGSGSRDDPISILDVLKKNIYPDKFYFIVILMLKNYLSR